ncbi:unnamed protein product, partial [Prorocentrum cordatum]
RDVGSQGESGPLPEWPIWRGRAGGPQTAECRAVAAACALGVGIPAPPAGHAPGVGLARVPLSSARGRSSVPLNDEIMACSSWQEVLGLAGRKVELMDELNIVTALTRTARLHRDGDGGRTPLERVRGHEGLCTLLEHARHFAVRCRPQQLANAAWSCAVLLCQDAPLLQKICGLAVSRLGGFTTQNVANTVWALGTLGFHHEEMLRAALGYAEANIRDFTPQDLGNTCWAFARLQRQCDSLFQLVVRESLVRLNDFQPQNMSNLVWACATILYKDEAAMHVLATHAAGRVTEFTPQELSNLTWGMATLNLMCEPWLSASGAEMAVRSRECCPQDLSNTLWAYGTLKYKCNDHVRAMNWQVMRLIEHFSPQGLSNVAWGLSAMEYRDQMALTCICEEAMRRPLEQMTPPDVSTLLYSCAVLAWLHDGFLAWLRRAIRYLLPVFATRDVANVSWAMVILSHRDDHIFRQLMARSLEMLPDFNVQGLCNIAWAFVRFGVEVPAAVALGIAEQAVRRRPELAEEPGDAVLLSDAVCSEWLQHVPAPLFEACDAIGREHFDRLLPFLADMSNIPSLGCARGEAERYQQHIEGLNCIQLGRRLTVELLRRLGMLEDSREAAGQLRSLRERWLADELESADPTDATIRHKTIGAWSLASRCGSHGPEIVASGSPMGVDTRFVSCVVEHSRASDAEFQVLNRAADRLLSGFGAEGATLRVDVSEIPCLSCLGAFRQFQKAFPGVNLCASFNIRKVSDICDDRSAEAPPEPPRPPPRAHLAPPTVLAPDNRGRPPPRASPAPAPDKPARAAVGASAAQAAAQDATPPRPGAPAPDGAGGHAADSARARGARLAAAEAEPIGSASHPLEVAGVEALAGPGAADAWSGARTAKRPQQQSFY